MNDQFYFKSDLFEIIPGEDDETNPGCYGKSLALWLSEKFRDLGYSVTVLPEDWGWLVEFESNEYWLSLCCGAVGSPEEDSDLLSIEWLVYPKISIPFYMVKSKIKHLFGKLDLRRPYQKLTSELVEILNAESRIEFIDSNHSSSADQVIITYSKNRIAEVSDVVVSISEEPAQKD